MSTSYEKKPFPETTSHVELSIMDGGGFTASTSVLHADVEPEKFHMIDWSFHIYHPNSKRHVLWDLGLHDVLQTCGFCASEY